MSDIAKLRKTLGLSQQGVADKASVTRSIVSEVEGRRKGLSVAASLKAAPVLGVGPGVLYLGTQLAAIKAKVEEEEVTEEVAADKLLRVLRTLLTAFEDVEEEEGADQLIDELEALLSEYTGNAVSTARGGKGVATKNAGYHPAFDVALKYASGGTDGRDFDVDDGRDAFGIRRPDLDGDYQDEDDFPEDAEDDGRNIYGVRTRPLDGQGR